MIQQKLSKIKKKELSAVDNVKKFLEVINKDNKKLNIFLYVAEKEAFEQAKKVDDKIKKGKAGKLAGLVVSVKACINVLDMPISCASKTLEDYNGTFDADVVAKIKTEDGIIIGITNMDEFACGVTGEYSAFGATQNPKYPGYNPGGSSSGPAASIAAGMCDIALGSDTGGSIRNPANNCAVIGIKPSYGRVSRYGLIDMAMSLDCIGSLSGDVYGSALMMEVIAGYSENDASSVNKKTDNYTKFDDKIKTIGLSDDFEKIADKEVYAEIKKKAEELAKKLNAKIKNVKLNYIKLAVQTYYPIVYTEVFSGTRKFDGRKYGKKIEDVCKEEVLRRILGGREISLAEHDGKYYKKALMVKNMITKDFEKAFREVDVILLPTLPGLPTKLGELTDPKEFYAMDAFTIPASLAGICGGVVPIAEVKNLPVGMQILADRFEEKKMISVMKAVEELK